jgi:hypothetical protein
MSEVEGKTPPRDDEEDADGDEAPKEEESTANFEPVVSEIAHSKTFSGMTTTCDSKF